MRTRVALVFLIALCSSLLIRPQSVLASIPVPLSGPQERYAVLIGVDGRDASISSRLRHIGDLLRNEFGYRRENVVEMLNGEATLDNIRGRILDMKSRMKLTDSLLVLVALPTARTPDDVVAVPAKGDPAKPWTVLSTNDFAQWFGKATAGQVVAIIPACVGYSKASAYAFEELRYTWTRQGSLQIVSICDDTGEAMASIVGLIENLLATSGRVEMADIFKGASRFERAVNVITIGEFRERPFAFTREQNKLLPLVDTITNSRTTSSRVSAIQEIVSTIKAEPGDRRPALINQAGATLTNAVADPDRAVRLAASWAVGEIAFTPAAPQLANQFVAAADEDEKKTIITALNTLESGEVLGVVRRGLEDPSAKVRIATLRAGATVRDDAVMNRIVVLGTADPSPDVRAAVLQIIPSITLPDQMKIDVVSKAFKDPDPAVRREAVGAWTELGQPAANAVFFAMLKNDRDDVRQAVAYALGRGPVDPAGRTEAVTRLVSILSSSQNASVREAAAWSLGRLGGDAAERALDRSLASQNSETSVRVAAAEALGNLKAKRGVPTLIAVLRAPAPEVRRAAADALGAIGDDRALDALLAAVADSDPQVRKAAESALNKIIPNSAAVLLRNLSDKSPAVRVEAAEKLASVPTPAVAAELIRHLTDPDPLVQQTIVKSLSQFTDDASRNQIKAALNNPDPRVQEGAVKVVGMQRLTDQQNQISMIITNPRNPGSLRAEAVRAASRVGADPDVIYAAARDSDPQVREASVDALRAMPAERRDRIVEELKRLSNDLVLSVREKAISALRQFSAIVRKD